MRGVNKGFVDLKPLISVLVDDVLGTRAVNRYERVCLLTTTFMVDGRQCACLFALLLSTGRL